MFTALNPAVLVPIVGITANVWKLNIASGAPAGATGVELQFHYGSGNYPAVTVRKSGSSDAFTSADVVNSGTSGGWLRATVGVDAQGRFDYFSTTATPPAACYLRGYYGDEAVFYDTLSLFAVGYPTAGGTLTDCTWLPAEAAAVFVYYMASAGFSATQSSASTDSWSPQTTSQDVLVALDASRKFWAKASSAPSKWGIRGYLKKGALVWHPNSVERATLNNQSVELPRTRSAAAYLYQCVGSGAAEVQGDMGSATPMIAQSQSAQILAADQAKCYRSGTINLYELGFLAMATPSKMEPYTKLGSAALSSSAAPFYYADTGTGLQRRTLDIMGSRSGKRGIRR